MEIKIKLLPFWLLILSINFLSCANIKENLDDHQILVNTELSYSNPLSESSVVFFGYVGLSLDPRLSCWKGLKVRSKNGKETVIIDTIEHMFLIADHPDDITVPKLVTWSEDFEVILFHIAISETDEKISLNKINILNCIDNPLLGIDVKGLTIANYGVRREDHIMLIPYNNCKGTFSLKGHNYSLDVSEDNKNYKSEDYMLARDLFYLDYSKIETQISKGNKDAISKIYNVPLINSYLETFPINDLNVTPYNNIAYHLEQNGKFKAALTILIALTIKYPTRTVAYINLGDSYWGLKETAKAKTAYSKYIDLMKKSDKEAKIPKRVLERVK